MYLPSLEMQQYAGQLLCPFCIQDVRKEVAAASAPQAQQDVRHAEFDTTHPNHCDRCGKESEKLYLWNHLYLCKKCLEEGQKTWKITGSEPPPSVELTRNAKERHLEEEKRERQRFEDDWRRQEREDRAKNGPEKQPIFARLLRTIGVDKSRAEDEKKRRGEIVVAPTDPRNAKLASQDPRPGIQNIKPGTNNRSSRSRIPNIDLARPMSEGKVEPKEEIELERKPAPKRENVGSVPQTEGLMAAGGAKKEAQKDVSKKSVPKKNVLWKKDGKGKK